MLWDNAPEKRLALNTFINLECERRIIPVASQLVRLSPLPPSENDGRRLKEHFRGEDRDERRSRRGSWFRIGEDHFEGCPRCPLRPRIRSADTVSFHVKYVQFK